MKLLTEPQGCILAFSSVGKFSSVHLLHIFSEISGCIVSKMQLEIICKTRWFDWGG